MGQSRFVRPDTRTLTLANGDTLTVKRRLNAFEGRRMRAMQKHPSLAEPGLVLAYLVDWSLPEIAIRGKSHEDLANALDALNDDDFEEIFAAIQGHATAMTAERAAEKKTAGTHAGSPTLSSAAPLGGPLSTSTSLTPTSTT